MRLPALDGQRQPTASTSGRPFENHGATLASRRARKECQLLRKPQRHALAFRFPASAAAERNECKLCILQAAPTDTQTPRLGQSQVLRAKAAAKAIPEHWMKHLQKAGEGNQRRWKSYLDKVAQINGLEPSMEALSDAQLATKTADFKRLVQSGKSLDELLPEAFAVVREASKRVLNMRHYDVQLMGGMALHEGTITEMPTGEGKTLAATLPAYLNALSGAGVHVVTVNDYLAKRDSEWMGKLYSFLGLSVGVVQEQHSRKRRRVAFGADVTYVTSNSLGFTYLGDTSTALTADELAIERPFNYAIVDEADSVLIDDCTNPLIMASAPDTADTKLFELAHKAISPGGGGNLLQLREQLMDGDSHTIKRRGEFVLDRQSQRVSLTPSGMWIVLQRLLELGHQFANAKRENRPPTINDLWEDDAPLGPYVLTALRARELHKRDEHYIVRDGEIKIVNASTGRVLPSSRWTDDLHQAIEAQEPGVEIKGATHIISSITYQTLFKYYPKLSGMTGTALSAEEEFFEVYGLHVLQIPTHKPSRRTDHAPRVYYTEDGYLDDLYRLLKTAQKRGRPVLMGTASIADSESYSRLLTSWAIPHQMLNARPQYVRREAKVIAQAGVPEIITIATNMAGRGVDILMGGNPEGLAQMALEQLILKPHLSEQEWALEYESLPSHFHEFSSEDYMRQLLPPQLYGAIKRMQAFVKTETPKTSRSRVLKDLVQLATLRAEQAHQRFVALHGAIAGKQGFEASWQQMLHVLEDSEVKLGGREDLNSASPNSASTGARSEAATHSSTAQLDGISHGAGGHEKLNGNSLHGAGYSSSSSSTGCDQDKPLPGLDGQEMVIDASQNGTSSSSSSSTGTEPDKSQPSPVGQERLDGGSANGASLVGASLSGANMNGAGSRKSMEAELTKALLSLWLYFDQTCLDTAQHVREEGGLQVLVLAIQESLRVDRQLKGRAGRQGDPGETYTLVRMDDPRTCNPSMQAAIEALKPIFLNNVNAPNYVDNRQAQWYINVTRQSMEHGKQDSRMILARNDRTVEIFRRNKVEMRMQLLKGTQQERRQILHAAIVDFAQWLVQANTNLAHPPCEPEWDLQTIISQARCVINPHEEDKLPMPKNKEMLRMLKDILKLRELPIPVRHAQGVLGPGSDAGTARRLRAALIMRPRDPDFGPVPGASPELKAELKAQLLLQRERAELEGSGFAGRWQGGAEALVLHIAASMVAAYEKLKEGAIMEAFTKWKAYYALATADADFKQEWGPEEQLRQRWERATMIKVLDEVWAEFLKDVESVKTAVGVRTFAHLNPDDEFRLEASDLYLKTLRRFRQRWVTNIACGPQLFVDLCIAEKGMKRQPLKLDIGQPIHDLSEGLKKLEDEQAEGKGLAARGGSKSGRSSAVGF